MTVTPSLPVFDEIVRAWGDERGEADQISSLPTYTHIWTQTHSFSLPSMVEAEPSYSAALALYLALALYEVKPPQGKTWLEVLGVADEARFLGECVACVGGPAGVFL